MSVLKESMGELFHTALRKGCDSKWSSIIWNAFHLCPDEMYADFIQHLIDHAPEDDKVTSEWVKVMCDSWDMHGSDHFAETHKLKWEGDKNTWAMVIGCTLQIIPDDDAEGIAGFMNYCVEYEG